MSTKATTLKNKKLLKIIRKRNEYVKVHNYHTKTLKKNVIDKTIDQNVRDNKGGN